MGGDRALARLGYANEPHGRRIAAVKVLLLTQARPSGASCDSWFGPKHWLDGRGAVLVKLIHRHRVARGRFVRASAPRSEATSIRVERKREHAGAADD